MEKNQAIGRAIYNRRVELDVNQKEVARAAGIQQPALSRLEHGGSSPTVDTLEKLSYALGVPTTHFLSEEQSFPKNGGIIFGEKEVVENVLQEDLFNEVVSLRSEVSSLKSEILALQLELASYRNREKSI